MRPGLPTATATVRVIAWVTEPDIRTPESGAWQCGGQGPDISLALERLRLIKS